MSLVPRPKSLFPSRRSAKGSLVQPRLPRWHNIHMARKDIAPSLVGADRRKEVRAVAFGAGEDRDRHAIWPCNRSRSTRRWRGSACRRRWETPPAWRESPPRSSSHPALHKLPNADSMGGGTQCSLPNGASLQAKISNCRGKPVEPADLVTAFCCNSLMHRCKIQRMS